MALPDRVLGTINLCMGGVRGVVSVCGWVVMSSSLINMSFLFLRLFHVLCEPLNLYLNVCVVYLFCVSWYLLDFMNLSV